MTAPYQTWDELEHHLSRRLTTLALDDAAILNASPLFVQLAQDPDLLELNAVGNNSLPGDAHLTEEQNAALADLGWLPPGLPDEPHWHQSMPWPPTVDAARRSAVLLTTTLRDIFAVTNPQQITVTAFNTRTGTPLTWK
jgi:hypothetical protein